MEHQAKLAARAQQAATTGKKPTGRGPRPPQAGPRADGQIDRADEAPRIMPDSGGGFEQSYSAQAVADTQFKLILATHVIHATNDKEQIEPMVKKVQSNPEGLNRPQSWLARATTAR